MLIDIPVGARFQDPEVAAKLTADTAAGLVACSTIMGQSIREDIAYDVWSIPYAKSSIWRKSSSPK